MADAAVYPHNIGDMATRYQIQRTRSASPAWVDDFPDDALESLLSALPDADVYALIDNAFDTDFARRLHARFPTLQSQSLYAGRYDAPGLAEIAPSVVRIPDNKIERRAFLEVALGETSGNPMLSFLHSSVSTCPPYTHLIYQMKAVDPEGEAFIVRFADTRALELLLQVFDDTQRARFLGALQWWYFRRDGSLQRVSHAGEGAPEPTDAPYVFTREQMGRVDALARPDGVLRLIQTNAHWFGALGGAPSQAHACIRSVLESFDTGEVAHDATVFRLVAEALTEAGLLESQQQHVQSEVATESS